MPIRAGEGGATWQSVAEEPGSFRTWKTGLSIHHWPDGFTYANGDETVFDHHPQDEEMWVLEGRLHYDHWFSMAGPAYIRHPPFFMHPSRQRAEGRTVIVNRYCVRPIVNFEPIPPDWDGVCRTAPGTPTRNPGVQAFEYGDLPWGQVLDRAGRPLGYEAKHLADDADDGWTSSVLMFPPGWQGQGPRRELEGGSEILVLGGDLTLDRGHGPHELEEGTYWCDPDHLIDGGSTEKSKTGCLALRWTRGDDRQLPAPLT